MNGKFVLFLAALPVAWFISYPHSLDKYMPKEKFSDFEVTDIQGQPLSTTSHRGHVVMIDFWATWCGPCREEIPNVAAVYQHYHDKGFDVIGVSLDQAGGRDAVIQFAKDHNMPWPQYFDGKDWNNALAVKYGIRSIPSTILIDRNGQIISREARGPYLGVAVAKALAATGS